MSNQIHFIEKAAALIRENLANEQFGVSELAAAMHMSRSNLLRKIKKETQLSASQFIRQIRLEEGMELLQETSLTVSEISHQVGFGSTSYFIKCFREHFGYPPGEVGKGLELAEKKEHKEPSSIKLKQWFIGAGILLIALILGFLFFPKEDTDSPEEIEKSIAVLPFKNESNDATNLYFVNGLMESALNNLQKIEDLRVISRTSVEQYRETKKSVAEIAEELQVNYLVEGSGQRVGDQILLNIQLIDAATDTPIWTEQYEQKVLDVFDLQNEIAKKIANAVEAKVTSEELALIEKKPTENLLAYDYYLQALPSYNTRTKEGLETAIPLFEKAIEEDPNFALAYANISISYYYLDLQQKQKQHTERINNYADKALLYNSKSDVSLIAKALYYMHTEEYKLALPHLEKALEYNPNSSAVIQVISALYANYILDTGKYLKYALMGEQLDIAANDSVAQSYIYLNLSNAFIQTGFPDKALEYVNKSLDYDANNYYAPYVKAFVLYAKNGNLKQTRSLLVQELEKDSTRLDILQEIAKLHYLEEDYDSAFQYYQKFVEIRKEFDLDIYPQENIKIAVVYEQMGLKEEAAAFFEAYSNYCDNDASLYKSASTATKFMYEGKQDQAIEQLKIFATQDNYQYWILIFFEMDPLVKTLQNHPEYAATVQKIKDQFWKNQAKLKKSLSAEGLL